MKNLRSELIDLFLDGEASPSEAAELEQQLASDPVARACFEAQRALHETLDGLPTLDPPPGLTEQVLARVDSLPAQPETPAPVTPRGSGLWDWLHGARPVLAYASFFAAGLVIAAMIYELGDIAEPEPSMISGTMIQPGPGPAGAESRRVEVELPGIAYGSIVAQRERDVLVMGFELETAADTEVVLPRTGTARIVGIAGLREEPAQISLEAGRFSMRQAGEHRYTVYLHGHFPGAMPVQIYRQGILVEEFEIEIPADAEE
ncbi:MAG: anti-sigma factor family protein [Wenzhouxiangellaceae bacterium]